LDIINTPGLLNECGREYGECQADDDGADDVGQGERLIMHVAAPECDGQAPPGLQV